MKNTILLDGKRVWNYDPQWVEALSVEVLYYLVSETLGELGFERLNKCVYYKDGITIFCDSEKKTYEVDITIKGMMITSLSFMHLWESIRTHWIVTHRLNPQLR
jgi:hypothetical protein